MGINLSEDLRRLGSATVTLRGTLDVTVTPVMADTTDRVAELYPRPPLQAATKEGRAAELRMPAYQARCKEAWRQQGILIMGIACDFTDASGEPWTPERDREWCDAYIDHIRRSLTFAEYERLEDAYKRLASGETAADDAEAIGDGETEGN